ncbi:acyl-CoA thioester hydrolase/BAAT C-terminal domain-containing protein [Bacillus sp. JCM 19041]|uniref:acyl-CoA thioester hydrolase/BAAT C-terminal domain-containing protein n=1 Tax=Bacillus sp. JCM 19041 TaxID=1460637 RepID=UPI0009EB1175
MTWLCSSCSSLLCSRRITRRISRIPLEYVETAFQWLGEQDQVDKGKFAIVGFSRGSELALLAGTVIPELKAIIAVAPVLLCLVALKTYK